MNITQSLKERLKFFHPTKEEVFLVIFLGLFFPLPAYFIAGWGIIPPLYTAIIIIAFISPFLSGMQYLLLLLYSGFLPLICYLFAVALSRKIANKRLLFGAAIALIVISLFMPMYLIVDSSGEKAFYNAIKLYVEIF